MEDDIKSKLQTIIDQNNTIIRQNKLIIEQNELLIKQGNYMLPILWKTDKYNSTDSKYRFAISYVSKPEELEEMEREGLILSMKSKNL